MLVFLLTILLCWAPNLGLIAAAHDPGNVALQIRNRPGMTDADTLNAVKRALYGTRHQSRDTVYSMNRTFLSKSWKDASLFPAVGNMNPSIGLVCSTCYVKGSVTGDLTLTGDFNLTDAIDDLGSDISNVTTEAFKQLESYAEQTLKDIEDWDIEDVPAWPTLHLDLNLDDITTLPEAQVHFEFDDLELYLDLDIQLSAQSTYTINLFSSETPEGFSVPGLTVGAVFSVNLVLIADAEIDIGSGIHIKLNDGLAFDLEMFNSNVSGITLPGGSYEFLPVTIEGSGSLRAVLSLQASLGIDLSGNLPLESEFLPNFSAGVEAGVFAYIADFNVEVDGSRSADGGDCELGAELEYTVALGAAAGATIAVETYSWGPAVRTTVPIWYTTLASICAKTKATPSTASVLITAPAALNRRHSSSVTSMVSEETYTIVNCLSSLINCPVNLQTTTSYKSTVTSTVTVQYGSTATFPANTFASVTSAIPFGTNVHILEATSGAPTSYVPPSATGGSILDRTTGGTNNKLIIGLCVGLGLPVLATLIIGISFYIRKCRQYSVVEPRPEVHEQYEPYKGYDQPFPPRMVNSIPRKPVAQTYAKGYE